MIFSADCSASSESWADHPPDIETHGPDRLKVLRKASKPAQTARPHRPSSASTSTPAPAARTGGSAESIAESTSYGCVARVGCTQLLRLKSRRHAVSMISADHLRRATSGGQMQCGLTAIRAWPHHFSFQGVSLPNSDRSAKPKVSNCSD